MKLTLKAARVNQDLTQKEAAKLIGVVADTVSNWEAGKTYPGLEQLSRIEEVYKISYNDIIFLPKQSV